MMIILWMALGFFAIEAILWFFFRKELLTNIFSWIMSFIVGDESGKDGER